MRSSLVITTWNRARQLERCLWSILDHGTRHPDEIVVVDDDSTDHTVEVVRQAAERFPEVAVSYTRRRKADLGWSNPAIPRNQALRLTDPASEVLLLTEPEMLWMPDTLAQLMRWFEQPPAHRPQDPQRDWLPLVPRPERYFVTASHIGYCMTEEPVQNDRWRDPAAVFGHAHTDRRWPEINTRVTAVLRADLFTIRGWCEAFIGWGYDDTDVLSRLGMIGVEHIALHLPVVHMPHDPPPAHGEVAEGNLVKMQFHQAHRIYAPNPDTWGQLPAGEPGRQAVAPAEWAAVQADELASWTDKAWPSRSGKLVREQRYLRQAAEDLGLVRWAAGLDDASLSVDVGCGPYSVLELPPRPRGRLTAFDPLHAGYQVLRAGQVSGAVVYAEAMAECLPLPDGAANLVVSINGLDHFQDPRRALVEMARVLAPGGHLALHFCLNNASQGHPHPAHKIDLDADAVHAWAVAAGLHGLSVLITHYGWRHQSAAALVFVRPEAA